MRLWRLVAAITLFAGSTPAFALVSEVWNYVKQYQFGVDYTSSFNSVEASYDTAHTGEAHPNCDVISDSKERCHVYMDGGSSSGYGFLLQQAFRRQGTFYFKPDLGFGVRYLNGRLAKDDAARQAANDQPLDSMRFSLLAVVVKPTITVGVTPANHFPDFLLSLGPALQIAAGKVGVNDESKSVVVATSSELLAGFFEEEVVFWRFGDGALSAFSSQDFTGSGRGSKFYPDTVDGMDNIRAQFSRRVGGASSGSFWGLGVKLVLNWP